MPARRRDLPTDVAKALSHPLRQRLLMVYNEKPASPSEAARRLNESLGDVAYHTKRLVDHGCLELVGATPGRGGVKHVYRATLLYEVEEETWGQLPPALRGSLAGRIVSELGRDVSAAGADGGFEDEDVHLSRVVLMLDTRARQALSETLRETVARVDRIAEESRERGAGDQRSVLAVMHFRTSDA
jgi:DNA-binding transcriptional ArsR family regulator